MEVVVLVELVALVVVVVMVVVVVVLLLLLLILLMHTYEYLCFMLHYCINQSLCIWYFVWFGNCFMAYV